MVLSLAALSLALVSGTPAGTSDAANDWLELDTELSVLTTKLATTDADGARVSGYFIGSWDASDDPFFVTAPAEMSGMTVRAARVNVTQTIGDVFGKVSFELGSGTATLKDAYMRWKCGEALRITFGQFREKFLYSGFVSDQYNLFLQRGLNGDSYDRRNPGFMVEFDAGQFALSGSVQNGADGTNDEHRVTGRVEYAALGKPFDKHQGAWGASEGTNLGVAGVYGSDGFLMLDNDRTGGEVELSIGSFYIHADVISYPLNFDSTTNLELDPVLGISKANTSPYTVTLSYLWGDGEYEVAIRREEFDDVNATRRNVAALIWYLDGAQGGHDLKWILQWLELDSNVTANQGNLLSLGLTVVWK